MIASEPQEELTLVAECFKKSLGKIDHDTKNILQGVLYLDEMDIEPRIALNIEELLNTILETTKLINKEIERIIK